MVNRPLKLTLYDQGLFDMLKRAREAALDLRPVFKEILNSWFKGNRAIFSLKGPGKYQDLKESYKERKKADHRFVYPILKASGRLEKSMIQPGDGVNIITKTGMQMGTSVPYAVFLQNGTKFMPARPPVLLGPEIVAPDVLKKRSELWVKMISDYIALSLGIKNV